MNTKTFLPTLVAASSLGLIACSEQPPEKASEPTSPPTIGQALVAQVQLANPSDFPRPDAPYYTSFDKLGLGRQEALEANLSAKFAERPQPIQLIDRNGDGELDGIFTLLSLTGEEQAILSLHRNAEPDSADINKRTQAEISRRTGGSWQEDPDKPGRQIYTGGEFENVEELTPPSQHSDHSYFIRYEGPGIESDKVGYRIYLDERNGFDIFGKKTNEMVLQDVGQDGFDSYHEPAEWGMDILKVGESLGAGGYGFWNGERVERVSDVSGWTAKILDDGSLYSSFSIDYKNWQIDNRTLNLNAQLAMHGGSRLVHTKLTLSEPLDNIAIGLVKHPGTELIQGEMNITGKAYTYVASWGKQSLSGDHLGMALLFRKADLERQTQDQHNYVSVMDTAGEDLDYYFLAAWEAEPEGIKSRDQFVAYLEREAEKLTLPLRERLTSVHSQAQKSFPTSAESALEWSKRLADSELERKTLKYHHKGWDSHRQRKPKFEYDIVGLLPLAYDELNNVAPHPEYAQAPHKTTATFITDNGNIHRYDIKNYNIDSIKPGDVVLRLYQETGEKKYKEAADLLRRQLEKHPRTSEGAFWHKQKYQWQLWLDGVYMGMPFLAQYSQLFEEGGSHDQVVEEFEVTRKHLRDPETGLYYHAWDEKKQQDWADPETGLSPHFWGRGMGWLAMALVDTLDYIPEEDAQRRQPLIDMIQEMAPTLVQYQDADTGTWWQIMDMPDAAGNYRESSASSMFTYFFAKAINNGYLDESYKTTAQKAYDGLIKEFVTVHSDGKVSLTNICYVAGLGFGRDGSYHYYMSEPVYENDPKGTGPFILAGIEMYKLLK